MLRRLLTSASFSVLLVASPALATNYSPGDSASWFAQIGETAPIEALAKGGAGVTIALVDTGVVASNPEIAGRVSNLSSCAAVSFACPNGFVDDEGHGTATASIAAGQVGTSSTMSGVAPAATIVSEKVLNASGNGTDADVANGIIKAANTGAQVISLSLTYLPTSAVVNAINYAAAKGAVIVYAGGNSSQPLNGGGTSFGFTQTALTHLMFAGSVSASNTLSSFSNTPGTGMASAGGAKQVSYASLWIMAPGENINAPGIQFDTGGQTNQYALWTGTSMATPMVAGSIALLEATWPILAKNGTAVSLLFATATDLGTPGVDNSYGHGLLNLARAFQPVGALSVIGAHSSGIPVKQIVNATLSSSALGLLNSIRNKLASFTTFDAYTRNFSVNLTGLIGKPSSLQASVFSIATPAVVSASRRLAGGGVFSFASSDTWAPSNLDMLSQERQRSEGGGAAPTFYMSLISRGGAMGAVGRGLPASAAFTGALWGPEATAGYQADDLGVSNALMGLAQGGYFAAAGAPLGDRTRLAMSWSASPVVEGAIVALDPELPRASALAFGVTHRVTARWSVGLTYNALSEGNGLLGASYALTGPLSLGADHRSQSVGVSSAFDLGGRRSLLIDASLARTSGALPTDGLIGQVSALSARAYGVSLVQADAFQPGDRFTVSLRKPLRVTGGSAQLAVSSVDSEGDPITTMTPVSLRPNGDETDVSVGYSAVMHGGLRLNTGLSYRADADNVRGAQDVAARMAMSLRF